MMDPVIQVTHPHLRPTFQQLQRLVDHVKKHVLDEKQRWEDLLPLPLIEQAEVEWLDEGRWGSACYELSRRYHQLIGDQLLESSQHHDRHIHSLRSGRCQDEDDRLSISGLPFSPQVLWIAADAKITYDRDVEITVRIKSTNSYLLRTAYRPDWAMRNPRPDVIRRWAHRRFRFRTGETRLTCPGLERNDQ